MFVYNVLCSPLVVRHGVRAGAALCLLAGALRAGAQDAPQAIHGAFLSWMPTEAAAACLKDAGLTDPCYYFNNLYAPASAARDDVRIVWKPEPQRAIQGWEQLARTHGLNLVGCVNSWAKDEQTLFGGKDYRHLVTASGADGAIPCPAEPRFWDVVGQEMELLARVGPGVRGGLLDCEAYDAGAIYPGFGARTYNECYCDHCYGGYLAARGLPGPLPPPAERFRALTAPGRADDYVAYMEAQMADVGRAWAGRIRACRSDFQLGLLNPFGWYGRGLLRGLAEGGAAVPVWGESTYWRGVSPEWDEEVRQYRALGPRVRIAGGLALSGWGPRGLAVQAAALQERSDGYWLFCANSLLADRRQQEEAKDVWRLKVLYADGYCAALRAVSVPAAAATPPGAEEVWSDDLLAHLAAGTPTRPDAGVTWPAFASEDLLANGGFEDDFGALDDSKALRKWRAYYAHPERVTDGPREGRYACRMVNANREQPCAIYQVIAAQPGQSYRLRGFFRTEYLVAGQGLRVALGDREAGRWWGHYPEWTPFSVTAACPADGDRLMIGVEMHYTLGTAWLDGLTVTPSPRQELLCTPFALPAGHAWGALRWQASVPAGARLEVDLLQPAETRADGAAVPSYPLALAVAKGQDLGLLNRVGDLRAVQVRVTAEPDDAGRYPVLAALRISTRKR